jgi:hypothetical protein
LTGSAGGGIATFDANPIIIGCRFLANTASDENGLGCGGGIATSGAPGPILVNCAFSGNEAQFGGGAVWNQLGSTARLVNCTVAGNTAGVGGGICDATGSQPTIANTILWANVPDQIFDHGQSAAVVEYSTVQNGWSGPGSHNMDADPLFRNAWGADGTPGTVDDDLRLGSGSPCIDAGDNTAVPPDAADLDDDGDIAEPVPLDLDGNARFVDDVNTPDTGKGDGVNPIVDMGAYEAQCPWDLDGSGDVGVTDFLALLAVWGSDPGGPPDFDGDGDVGITDFLVLLANWGPCS